MPMPTMPIRSAILAMLLAAGGCASNPPPLVESGRVGLDGYKLGAGDRLRITVFDEPTLTGEYIVTDSGAIAFPLVGTVPAGQGTLAELQERLRARLAAGYLKDPRVAAEVLTYRPFYILGEVNRPGQYPYAIGLKVEQAVATAGGYTYRANMRKLFLRRADSNEERTIDVRRQNVIVMPGDTLRIGERYL